MDSIRDILAKLRLKLIKLWWDHVTKNPEINKIKVFNKGISIYLNEEIP